MTKDIRDLLSAQPFQAFTVHTADGRQFRVSTRDHAQVSPAGTRVSIWTDDETHYILPALLISGLKIQANGRRKR